MKKLLFVLFFLPITGFTQNYDVLFIGNSYTSYNNLPDMIQKIASGFGDTINYDQSLIGGATLNIHSTNSQTLNKISQQEWDYVVLQAQSQEPSFPPSQVANDVYPYAQILIDSIESNSICTEPIFFMTWGRKYGDQQNCQFYPPICTYAGMQERLRESYLDMAYFHKAACAPVGIAWQESIAQDSLLDLYVSDGSHPSLYGSYLAACTFYAVLFKKSPSGSTYIPNGIDSLAALGLQQIASSIVLDSLSVWNIFNADFTNLVFGDTVSFYNISSNYDSVIWDFGDGTIQSILDDPIHTYSVSGTYNITLTASTNSNCLMDTANATVIITTPTYIEDIKHSPTLIKVIDILGRKSEVKYFTPLFYIYDDGTVVKRIILK